MIGVDPVPEPSSLAEIGRILAGPLPEPDIAARDGALARQALLTKPQGSLGRLEGMCTWLAQWQGRADPSVESPSVLVFAGNHGMAVHGVSAFPAAVTAAMVENFRAGGAAVNQLARLAGARFSVHALNLEQPTRDFTLAAAMSEAECLAAFLTGWRAVEPADLLCVGEMGIGNTTSAAALCAGLFGGAGADWVGPGTGVDAAGLKRKAAVVEQGLARHREAAGGQPLQLLRRLGGREMAAMAGAILAARARRIPVLLDGFVCGAAAAVLQAERPEGAVRSGALAHCLAAHVSAEPGHGRLLAHLGLAPLLDLQMRLGEASGAALAVLLARAALACHNGMATFADAGVPESEEGPAIP